MKLLQLFEALTDQRERMARAQKMGFDTSRVWYHGTAEPGIDSFQGWASKHVAGSFTQDPSTAASFADERMTHFRDNLSDEDIDDEGVGEVLYPVFLRLRNVFDVRNPAHRKLAGISDHPQDMYDYGVTEDFAEAIRGAGFDGYIDYETPHSSDKSVAVFDPANIRSIHAKFEDGNSTNIMDAEGLTEAPIRDFDVDASATTSDTNTWSDRDKQKLSNPAFEKLARKQIKTGIPIDVTIIGMPQDDPYDEEDFLDEPSNWMSGESMGQPFIDMLDDYSGVVDPDRFEHLTGIDIIPAPNAITAVFMSNTNDVHSAMPVSPWILCHRLSHSLFDAASSLHLGEMARTNAYPFITVPVEYLTMNSAKPGKRMANSGEIGVELMAQFLHDGKITLARPVGMNPEFPDNYVNLSNGHEVMINDGTDDVATSPDDLTMEIEDLESQLNISAGIIVNAALGMLVVAP